MAAADVAPARPRVRLVLYSGKSDYKLEMIHDEYSIECEDGDAFAFAKNEWYAIGLEVDGQLQKFQKGENVCMRVSRHRPPRRAFGFGCPSTPTAAAAPALALAARRACRSATSATPTRAPAS